MRHYRGLLRFILYAMVGAVGTMAQYVFLFASVSLHVFSPVIASMIGAGIGAIINYFLNARFTFRSKAHGLALPKFALTALFGALLNGLFMKLFIDSFFIHYLLAQVLSTLFVLMITYCINLVWTFRVPPNDAGA